jgi:XTP/dITP diphosphohydrolase
MDTVRGAEKAIAADRRGENVPAELDVATVGLITEDEWRAHWLPAVDEPEATDADAADDEPTDEAVDTDAEASEDAADDEQPGESSDAD